MTSDLVCFVLYVYQSASPSFVLDIWCDCGFSDDWRVTPQSHRVVRFVDTYCACYLAGVGQHTIVRTRGHAITNNWKRSMVRWSYVTVRLVVGITDRSYDQLLIPTTNRAQSCCRMTDPTIIRGVRWPITRLVMASCDRSCDCVIRDHSQLFLRP